MKKYKIKLNTIYFKVPISFYSFRLYFDNQIICTPQGSNLSILKLILTFKKNVPTRQF